MNLKEIVPLMIIIIGVLCLCVGFIVFRVHSGKKSASKWLEIVLIMIGISCIGGGSYFQYQRSMDLSVNDATHISNGYYLVRDVETELQALQEETSDTEQILLDVETLLAKLKEYSSYQASQVSTKKGQELIQNYYRGMGRLGVNISTDIKQLTQNSSTIEYYLQDITNIKKNEKDIIEYFRIDEQGLASQL